MDWAVLGFAPFFIAGAAGAAEVAGGAAGAAVCAHAPPEHNASARPAVIIDRLNILVSTPCRDSDLRKPTAAE